MATIGPIIIENFNSITINNIKFNSYFKYQFVDIYDVLFKKFEIKYGIDIEYKSSSLQLTSLVLNNVIFEGDLDNFK